MPILLEDLYLDTRQQYQLSLIGGKSGTNNIVNWIYVAEDIGNARFLKGGELIISTGFVASQEKDWLRPFISALIEKKTSGLILNIGKYVTEKDITPDVIQLCDDNHFPLLTMPWEIYLSDLSQDYCNRIFADRQTTYDLSSALRSLLREDTVSAHTLEVLTSQAYLANDCYCAAVLEISCEPSAHKHCIQQIRRIASYCPSARKADFVCFEFSKQLVFVWHDMSRTAIESHSRELLKYCETITALHDIRLGISQRLMGIQHLQKLYQQAMAALGMAKYKKDNWYHFDDLGCFQIFFSVTDHEMLKRYYKMYLKPLEDYDKAHDSNYLETLEYYLRFNQHLSQIADAMICHRNTINYRINKIREMLNLDLNDGENKFQLQLAINIRNFLKIFAPDDL